MHKKASETPPSEPLRDEHDEQQPQEEEDDDG